MKIKIFCLLLILIMPVIFIFTGCGTKSNNYKENLSTRFVLIEKVQEELSDGSGNGLDVYIIVDKETKIMYFWFAGYYRCSIETMLNEDGTPKLWKGDL